MIRWFLFLVIMAHWFVSPRAAEFPEGVEKITYPSKADDTPQPALFWAPETDGEKAPLLIVLHTWSGSYRQAGSQVPLARWCQQVNWIFLQPHFRGPNWTPQALGSDLVVRDIVSAVEFARKTAPVDERRIYCVGVSGGGHASLLMAARAPEIWAGVSAWCGISDIAAWHRQCTGTKFQRYGEHIEKALGGKPEDHPEDARHRSPVTWLEKNRGNLPPLDIWHGIYDGSEGGVPFDSRRGGSVPFTHSLRAWNAAVPDGEKLDEAFLTRVYEARAFPREEPPPGSGEREIHFRKTRGNVRVSIFEGGHEILHETALNWLAAQEKGKAPDWEPDIRVRLKVKGKDSESGK